MNKKRFLSILLIAMLIVTLIPVADWGNDNEAYAADWENKIYIGDTPVNQSTNGKSTDWVFSPYDNRLILTDGFVRLTSSNLPGSKNKAVIRVESLDNLTIQLLGKATVGVPSTEYLPPGGCRRHQYLRYLCTGNESGN